MPAPLKMASGGQSSAVDYGIYVVTPDDRTFYDIAEKVYGDGDLWRPIAEANPEADQARLRPGQQLVIPELRGAKTSSSDDDEIDDLINP